MSFIFNGTTISKPVMNGTACTEVYMNGAQVTKEIWKFSCAAPTIYDPGVSTTGGDWIQSGSDSIARGLPVNKVTNSVYANTGESFFRCSSDVTTVEQYCKNDAGGYLSGGIIVRRSSIDDSNLRISSFTTSTSDYSDVVQSANYYYSADTGLLTVVDTSEYIVVGLQGAYLYLESNRFRVDWWYNGSLANTGAWIYVERVNNV